VSRGGNADVWFLQRNARQAQVVDCSAGKNKGRLWGSKCRDVISKRHGVAPHVTMYKW